MMNSTEELRELLDELGVEWKEGEGWYDTEWTNRYGTRSSAMEWCPTLTVMINRITPKQAIEATLGPKTCHMEHTKSGPIFDVYRCDACECEITEPRCESGYNELGLNYCPNCGRRVMNE